MTRQQQKFLEGFLAAMAEVAKVTGELPIEGMSRTEWKTINAIQERLARVAAKIAQSE